MCGGDQVSAYLVDDFDPRRRAVQLLSAGDDVAQILAQLSLSISQVDKQLRKQASIHSDGKEVR
jgi:DNA-binding NarL/FixJ family response regulator